MEKQSKSSIIVSVIYFLLAILLLVGPRTIFKVCEVVEKPMRCYFSTQAIAVMAVMLIGIAIAHLFALTGAEKIRLNGLAVLSALAVILIPVQLIGGCEMKAMACQSRTFPAIYIISIVLIASALTEIVSILVKEKSGLKAGIRQTVSAVLSLTLLLTVVGCGNEATETGKDNKGSKDAEVIVGFNSGSLCLAPLHIALANGYFEAEFKAAGISWKIEDIDIANASELLEAGKINATVGLSGSLMQQMDNGLNIAFTGGLHTGCTKFYVKKDSGITSLEDLKGKALGVPSLTDSGTMVLKRKLTDVGIGVTTENLEVSFVPYGLTDLPLALENGAIDVAVLHDPVGYQAEQEYGFVPILDTAKDEKFSKEYCCQVYVAKTLADNNPKAAAAYTRALLKAAAFIQAAPDQAAQIQIDNGYCSGEPDTNAALLSSYSYKPSVQAGYDTFHASAVELQAIGELDRDKDIYKFIDEHYSKFEDVPESYEYHPADGTFTEIWE